MALFVTLVVVVDHTFGLFAQRFDALYAATDRSVGQQLPDRTTGAAMGNQCTTIAAQDRLVPVVRMPRVGDGGGLEHSTLLLLFAVRGLFDPPGLVPEV